MCMTLRPGEAAKQCRETEAMAVPHSSEWAPGNTCWNCSGRNEKSDSRQAAAATVGAVLDLWRMGRNMNSLRNMARLFHKLDLTFAVTACIPVLVEAALGAHLVRRSIFRDLKQNLATLRRSPYCLSIWQRSCQHFRSHETTNRKQLQNSFFSDFDPLKKTV